MHFYGARIVPGELTMRFDQADRILWTDSGRFLKRVLCPLHKRWGEMDPIGDDDRRRRCGSCEKEVINLEGVTDAEAEKIFNSDRETCVMIPLGATNITIHGNPNPSMAKAKQACPLRVIRTVRGLEDIRRQTSRKLRPFIVQVTPSEGIQMSVWQHRRTGEIDIATDMRFTPGMDCPAEDRGQWEMVLGWRRYSGGHRTGTDGIPIAAYMIPSDLKPGELVLVEDTIEVVASSVNISQGGVSGYRSAPAIWTGEGFEFCVPPPSECIG